MKSNEEIWELLNDQKWQWQSNVHNLANLAREVPDGGTIMDVGIGGAASACAMGLASKDDVRIYSVGPEIREVTMSYVFKCKMQGKIFLVPGTSDEVFERWNKELDMIFIDGMHHYDEVKRDGVNGLKWLRSGGILSFHDYDLYRNTIGTAIDELVEENKDKLEKILHEENLIAFRKNA